MRNIHTSTDGMLTVASTPGAGKKNRTSANASVPRKRTLWLWRSALCGLIDSGDEFEWMTVLVALFHTFLLAA